VKKAALLFGLCFALTATYASASIVGTTDSGLFQDHIDWCIQFSNCSNTPFVEPSPSAFTSTGGIAGFVGNVGTQQPFEVRQQGVSWAGNLPDGMGIVYNGVSTINNDPADIAATFGVGVFGAGAYIQAEHYGAFTATVTLFDANFQSLGSFTAQGDSEDGGPLGLFIGAYDTTADVYAIQFSVTDINGADDFGIGTMGLQTSSVPEPGTLMLLAPSALGLFGVVRRRMNRKSQEVQ